MHENLAELLGSEELSWLVGRLVTRIERGQPLDAGTVVLDDATPEQRRAVDDVLGRRSTTGGTLRVDLKRLCAALHTDVEGLRAVLVSLRGPVHDLRARRDARAAAWDALFLEWEERVGSDEMLSTWMEGLRRSGLLKRLAGGDVEFAARLCGQAHEVLAGAPHGDVLLATLAARVTGDSHALDRGRPLATLCLRAVADTTGIDGGVGAGARREAWATLGVCLDDLSAPVLCLNLRPTPGCACVGWIDWHVARGEPFYLTWRQVREFVPDPGMDAVHVCENPAVVSEAANRLGADCRPLVCLNGVPGSPAQRLLARIAEAGISRHLRADFDWTGLRIVDGVLDSARDRLWRMTPDDYHACRASQPLAGSPVHPAWAGDLSAAMETAGLAGYEEDIIERLLVDLTVRPAVSQ
jgi:uncharacterized protein (TIGR02679 family)